MVKKSRRPKTIQRPKTNESLGVRKRGSRSGTKPPAFHRNQRSGCGKSLVLTVRLPRRPRSSSNTSTAMGGSVAYALAVGQDKRIISATNIPKSTYSLYLLTTLDDEGFALMCHPDVTQEKIKMYKQSKKEQPKEPKKPRFSWIRIAVEEGVLRVTAGGEERSNILKQIEGSSRNFTRTLLRVVKVVPPTSAKDLLVQGSCSQFYERETGSQFWERDKERQADPSNLGEKRPALGRLLRCYHNNKSVQGVSASSGIRSSNCASYCSTVL